MYQADLAVPPALVRDARTLVASAPAVDRAFLHQLFPLVAGAAPWLASVLGPWQAQASRWGSCLLRGWPLPEPVPPTPLTVWPAPPPSLTDLWVLLVGSWLGDIQTATAEQHGALVRQICPTRPHAALLTTQSAQALGWHTEHAWHQTPPDAIVLACTRSDHARQAANVVVPLDALVACLSPADYALAQQPVFAADQDAEYGGGPGATVALLTPSPPGLTLRLDTVLMDGTTAPAQALLATLRQGLPALATSHVLLPGDLLLIDNRVAVHDRTAFVPHYDGTDRWLSQCYVRAAPLVQERQIVCL